MGQGEKNSEWGVEVEFKDKGTLELGLAVGRIFSEGQGKIRIYYIFIL